jgi:hypothetical protein
MGNWEVLVGLIKRLIRGLEECGGSLVQILIK